MPTPKPGAPIQSPCALAGITAAHARQAAATPIASFLILISGVIDLFGERSPARSVPLIHFGTRPAELSVQLCSRPSRRGGAIGPVAASDARPHSRTGLLISPYTRVVVAD